MLYFDLDGVLRDINITYLGYEPTNWNCGIPEKLRENPSLILNSPTTEYYQVVISYFKEKKKSFRILTYQLEEVIPYTKIWIEKYLKKYLKNIEVFYVRNPREKLDFLQKGDILIEDYPMYFRNDFLQKGTLVLINRNYNRNSFCHIRIYSPQGLKYYLYSLERNKRVFSLSQKVKIYFS